MLVIPAIDLRDGKCVRLRQGDYAQETVYSSQPWEMALHWQKLGARYLHLVDLDGAKTGQVENGTAIKGILEKVSIPCELGGGIRSEETIQKVLDWGIDRVIVGTKGLHDTEWLGRMAGKFPRRIALGIDARGGKVAVQGWLEESLVTVDELVKKVNHLPLAAIIFTDISKDGMLAGPNVEATRLVQQATAIPVIASGGVTTVGDIAQLRQASIQACIVGKALYDGKLTLEDALAAAGEID